jgi:O-antigen ligase
VATKSGKSTVKSPGGKRSPKGTPPAVQGKRPAGKPGPPPVGKRSASFTLGLLTGFADMAFAEKVVWACLHLLLFCVPLAMSNLSWIPGASQLPVTYDQFDIAKVLTMRALTLIAMGAWSWQILTVGGKLRRTKVDWFIVAFIAWVVLTTVFSVHWPTALFGKYRRFEGLISFVNYAAVFFLTVQMVDRPARIRSLVRTLCFAGVIVTGYGVLQYLGADPIKWGALPFEAKRSFSTYGNPDLLGGFIMFPLPITLGLALTEENEIWRVAYWLGFLIAVWCWITELVRGAWIGGALSLLIIAVAAIALHFRDEVRLQWLDAAAAALTAGVGGWLIIKSLASENPVMNVGTRLASITQFQEGSAKTRFEIWEAAWNAIKARPILGWGADTFRLVFPKYKPLAYTKDAGYLSVADNVHDYPLQLGSALGIPGFLLLYFGVFAVVGVLSGIDIVRRASGSARLLLISIWAAVFGYLVHLMFGLSVTGSTVILWFCLGILMAPLAVTRDVKAPSWGSVAAIVVVILLVVGSVGNVLYGVADNHYLRARVASNDPNQRIAEAQAAVNLNPFNDMYQAEVGLAYQDLMIGWISSAQQGKQTTPEAQQQAQQQAQQAFVAAEASMLKTIAFVPTEYDNYVFLANLYNQGASYLDKGLTAKAVDIGLRGIEVEPFGPAIRFQTALAYNYQGDDVRAIEQLETATKQDPGYAEPKMLLGDIYRRRGELGKAKEQYAAVLVAQPGNTQMKDAIASIDASLAAHGQETSRSAGTTVAP